MLGRRWLKVTRLLEDVRVEAPAGVSDEAMASFYDEFKAATAKADGGAEEGDENDDASLVWATDLSAALAARRSARAADAAGRREREAAAADDPIRAKLKAKLTELN